MSRREKLYAQEKESNDVTKRELLSSVDMETGESEKETVFTQNLPTVVTR